MNNLFLLLNFGTTEIIAILAVVVLLFGGKKIPELMRGVGRGIREFNNARANIESEIKDGIRDAERDASKKAE